MLQYFPNITGSLTVTGSVLISGSLTATQGITISGSIASASYALSASNASLLDGLNSSSFAPSSTFNTVSSSFASTSGSLSTRVTKIEGNYATTGSNAFNGSQNITGSLTVSQAVIAQTLNVQQVTSSIVYSCGSNTFGCALTDVQQFTGSLRVTGSGNNYFVGGNVGIGIASPNFPLHINSSTSISRIQLTNSSTGTTTGDGFQVIADGVNSTLSLPENGYMSFETCNTERFRITNGGTFVIGTTGITDPYTATGGGWQVVQFGKGGVLGAYRTDNESMTGFNTYTSAPDGTNKAIISNIGGTAIRYYEDRITFNTLSTSGTSQTQCERMRITSGGNVGIGTATSIDERLTVASTGTSDVLSAYRTQNLQNSFSGIVFAHNNSSSAKVNTVGLYSNLTACTAGAESADLLFYTRNSGTYAERMRITSGGNVQINGPVYRYNGQTVVGGSFTNLTAIDLSSSRTYLISMIPTNVEALLSYRIFGVIQYNATSGTFAYSTIQSQTMDVTLSGTTVQARVTNGQQWTFNWSILQLL